MSARSPRRIWIGTVALLAVGALGLLTIDTGLTQADAYRDEVESLQGQELLARSFPAGATAATDVIVPRGGAIRAVIRAPAESHFGELPTVRVCCGESTSLQRSAVCVGLPERSGCMPPDRESRHVTWTPAPSCRPPN